MSEVNNKYLDNIKKNKQFPESAGTLTFMAQAEAMSWRFTSPEDVIMHLAYVLCFSTGKRIADLHEFYCGEMDKIGPTITLDRHFRFVQLVSKGDPQGNGPDSGRTTLLLCVCKPLTQYNSKKLAFFLERTFGQS